MNRELKYWHLKLLENFSKYESQKLTWKQIATEVGASWTAVESFVRRNKTLFNESGVVQSAKSLMSEIDSKMPLQTSKDIPGFPTIVLLDIETSPLRSFTWNIWKQNVNPLNGQLIQDWMILSFAAKTLFEDDATGLVLTPKEVAEENDYRVVKTLWDILNDTDILIAHNGVDFDFKKINTRFLKHGLKPPSPYQVIDTLKAARQTFAVTSNKLDYLGEFLGLGRKIKTEFELWKKCMDGDIQALEDMLTYNIQDVVLLENVYEALRPHIKPHPNLNLYIGDNLKRCPACGHEHLEEVGNYYTYASVFTALSCKSCGHISRSRTNTMSVNQKKNSLISVPK